MVNLLEGGLELFDWCEFYLFFVTKYNFFNWSWCIKYMGAMFTQVQWKLSFNIVPNAVCEEKSDHLCSLINHRRPDQTRFHVWLSLLLHMPSLLSNRLAMTDCDQMLSNFMRKTEPRFCRADLLKLNNFTLFPPFSRCLFCVQQEEYYLYVMCPWIYIRAGFQLSWVRGNWNEVRA